MYYENMPLYPRLGPGCERDACVRVPVFGGGPGEPGRGPDPQSWRRVTIENPCRPGECAEVMLGVDDCGNLVMCVRRDPDRACDCRPRRPACRQARPCPPHPCPPPVQPREGCRGRLYGSWR